VDKNMTARWDAAGEPSSGWARASKAPAGAQHVIHKFYKKYQHSHEGGARGGRKEYGEEKTAGMGRFEAGKGH
jgi:hypothetical protein